MEIEVIKRCKMGTVVKYRGEEFYGHIIGFSRNIHKELVLVILREDGNKVATHPGNLEILD